MKRKSPRIAAEHATHALHLLIADGKLTASDVTNALKRREAMIADLRRRLVALERGGITKIQTTRRKLARTLPRKAKRRLSAASGS